MKTGIGLKVKTEPARRYFFAGLVVFLSFLLFAYKLPSSFVFADDFTRDLYDILGITRGKLTLLGPAVSFGGLRTGPYYYYLFAPIFFLTRASIDSILYFNAGLFAVALGFFFYQLSRRVGEVKAVAAAVSLMLVPVYLYGARNPSNAFTYLPLILVFLTILSFNKARSNRRHFLLGFLGGIAANFHFVTIPLFVFLFLTIFLRLRRKWPVVFLGLGFVATFLPLLFFELRHNFVMLRTTLQSSSAFLENRNLGNLPDAVLPEKYIPNNFFLLLSQSEKWISFSPFILLLLGTLVIFTQRKRTAEAVLFVSSFLIFFVLAFVMRYQFSPHYLVPYSFFLFFSAVVLLAESRWWFLLLGVIAFEIFSFPRQYYRPSISTSERFEKPVDYAIFHGLVSKTTSFNVLRIVQRTNLTTLGYEYRYFFRLKGYEPNAISEYARAKALLVFSDIPNLDLEHLSSWEIDQFGRQSLKQAQKFQLDSLTVYRLSK